MRALLGRHRRRPRRPARTLRQSEPPAAAEALPAAVEVARPLYECPTRPCRYVPRESHAAWGAAVARILEKFLSALDAGAGLRAAPALHELLALPGLVLADGKSSSGRTRRVNARLGRLAQGQPAGGSP